MADPNQGRSTNTSSPATKGALQGLWRWLFGEQQTSSNRELPSGIAGTTKLVIQVLWVMLAVGLLIELAYGFSLSSDAGFFFVTWAWIASLSAALAGSFLGLLFGLPSLPISSPSTRIEAPPTPPPASATPGAAAPSDPTSPERDMTPGAVTLRTPNAQVEQELPYNDSTSLEQIADWLTKIIVGLTLTQYSDWSQQFADLSRGLTIRLLGPGANCSLPTPTRPVGLDAFCAQSAIVPGGAIILSFAIIGFLGTYFWMRRYFIIEMVVGKQDAKAVMRARVTAELEEQRLRASEAEASRLRTELQASQQRAAMIASATTQLEEERLRASEAERKRLEIELAAAQAREARANEAIREARSMGNAQVEISGAGAPATLDALAARILDGAEALVSQDSPAMTALAEIRTVLPVAAHPDDPWQGRFGGSTEGGGVQLLATVSPLQSSQFFELVLEVKAVTPERAAELAGTTAVYFLHPTFGERPRSVSFGSDGRAPLQLYAYGAFTVGVLLQDGTKLELNLATIPNAPDLFRSR
jgi:hypothetical protein